MRLTPKVLLSIAAAIIIPGGFVLVPLCHLAKPLWKTLSKPFSTKPWAKTSKSAPS